MNRRIGIFRVWIFVSAVFAGALLAAPAYAANQVPGIVAITPSSGSSSAGTAVTFQAKCSDGNGAQDIRYVYFLVNMNIAYPKCLYAYYDRVTNKLYMMNDAGTAWVGGEFSGSSSVIENSYARLNCAKTVSLSSGTILTMQWNVTFKNAFAGLRNIYLYAKDRQGAVCAWNRAGAWIIKPEAGVPYGSIVINNGDMYSKSASVTLQLSANDNPGGSGLYQMKFSNDNVNWTAPESYAVKKGWSLTSGDGVKKVYVKFSDKAGNWSAARLDSINLDTVPPKIVITDPNGGAVVSVPALTASYTSDGAAKTKSLTLSEGLNTVTVSDADQAGNVAVASVQVTLALTPPTAAFTATPVTGETPLTVQFTDSSTGSVTGWLWSFGDSAASAEQSPAHTYLSKYLWETEYTGDDLPDNSSQAWTRYSTSNPAIEEISEGALHIKSNLYPDGDYVSYQRPASFKASRAYIVEARFRMGHDDGFGHGTTCLSVTDDKYSWRLDFSEYDIGIEYCIDRKATYRMDTVSDYHTYRVYANNGIVEVFVDGVKRMRADMTYTEKDGPYAPSIRFGQLWGQVQSSLQDYRSNPPIPNIETYWDYVRCHSFPSSMGYESYYNVSLAASGPGGVNTKTVSSCIDALPPYPEIFTTGLPDGVVHDFYSENIHQDYAVQPFTWSIVSGSLPPGLYFIDGYSPRIEGRPAQAGTYGFTLGITDHKGRTATKYVEMKVEPYPQWTDRELLTETMTHAAQYFYYKALSNGFVQDVNYSGSCSSVAATGFGLAAMCILDEFAGCPDNPYCNIPAADIRARVNQILDNCITYQGMQTESGNSYGIGGFLYHLINADGTRVSGEVSTVDMAIFMAGAVTAGEYFGGEIKEKVETIYNNLNWRFFLLTNLKRFSHGWSPNSGIIIYNWDRPGDEALLVSIMALGKEPEALDFLETMYSWPRVEREYAGYKVYNSYFGSLFTYYLAHCFVDFQKLGADNPSTAGFNSVPAIDWWQNSVNAAYAARQFCIDQSAKYPNSYGADSWGLTPCYNPNNYADYFGTLGASPCEASSGVPDSRGVIAPCGAISCLPFMRNTSDEEHSDENNNLALSALKNYFRTYYAKGIWGDYGPTDSFGNNGAVLQNYVGINVGPEALMISNYTSGLIWNNFMKSSRMTAALNKIFAK